MAHICMVLIGDIRYDGRVRKEIGTLVRAGHRVELVVSNFDTTGAEDQNLGIKLHFIPMTLWSRPVANFIEQIRFNYRASSVIKEIGPTHIHCHDLLALLA